MAPYQLLPDPAPGDRANLKASIAAVGVQVPVEYDDLGNILDGHTRLAICNELGITDWPSIVRPGLTEEQKFEHILTLNLARRHLSHEQRRELEATLRERGLSLRTIGGLVGVDAATVSRDLAPVANATPETVTGRDGKAYPARRPAVIVKNRGERGRALKALATLDRVPNRVMDARGLEKLAHQRGYTANGEAECDATIGTATLLLGDFREKGAEIADASVNLLFTDPPYAEEWLPHWVDLSEFAARVLKPDGMLIAYSGNLYAPEVLDGLRQHLRFYLQGAVVLPGADAKLNSIMAWAGSKPLWFFVRRDFTGSRGRWFNNTAISEKAEKDLHPWQQGIGPARYYIERLTEPGDLVVDPFLGGGTTGVAALELGRNFVGIELDPAAMATATARIRAVEEAAAKPATEVAR